MNIPNYTLKSLLKNLKTKYSDNTVVLAELALIELAASETLADQCFNSQLNDLDLFDKINKMVGCNTEKCCDDDFVFVVADVGYDYYDRSVEIILNAETDFELTPDHLTDIFDLGFDLIYVSKGEDGRVYSSKDKDRYGKCSARQPDDEMVLKKENDLLKKKVAEYSKEILTLRSVLRRG